MTEKEFDIDGLIAEYLSNGLEPERRAELDAWLAQSEENRRYFLQREEIWFSAISEAEGKRYDAGKAFELFRQRVKTHMPQKAKKRSLIRTCLRYAAVAAVLCLVVYSAYRQGAQDLKDQLAQIVVEAPLGSQTRMRLPDSTLVVLNAGSRMVYGQDFGVENRRVSLEGEGYFEVTRNAEKPFRVSSPSVTLTVLGTKFNFRDYSQEDEVIVSLREGRVALENLLHEEEPLALMPSERMVMYKHEGRMKRERMETDAYLKWMDGKLIFNGLPLEKVVQVLERSYGQTIRLENDTVGRMRLFGKFDRNEQGLKEILEIMQATGKVRYKKKKDSVILY